MPRYAIYFAPRTASPLWDFGCSVLGFDAESFADVPYPDDPLFADPAVLGWTAAPRRYGFHATLKAPFHLASGRDAEDLAGTLAVFTEGRIPFDVDLKLARFRDFLALVPEEPVPALDRLAEDCVRVFDPFRAPLTPADRERRHPDRLSPQERENLDRWGYPFVFDDFRFHMTLSGPVDPGEAPWLEPVLRDLFAAVPARVAVDGVALFRQDDPEGRFRVERRFPFRGAG